MNIYYGNKSNKIKTIKILRNKSKLLYQEQQLLLIEGIKEIQMALKGSSKYQLYELLICKDIVKDNIIINTNSIKSYISKKSFNKIAYRKNNGGLIAIFKTKNKSMHSIKFKHTPPLLLILENIEKPGNIGAILRSADAASVDGIILSQQKTNIFNPNTIRSSLGTVFTQEIIFEKREKILSWMRKKKFIL